MITKYENLTERNGQLSKRLTKKWAKILENTKRFEPIKNNHVKACTAMLLENEHRYLKEAATNSSIFGAQNGLTGGALNATDSYATGDFRLPRVIIPMLRRALPALMANEIVGVQPMPGPVALGFALRYKYEKGALHKGDTDTRHYHDEVKAEAHGKRGVECKIGAVAEGDTTLKLIDGQDYPIKQPYYVAQLLRDNVTWVASVNPLIKSLVGDVPNTATSTASAATAIDTLSKSDSPETGKNIQQYLYAKLHALENTTVVGISLPDDETNKSIKAGLANGGYGNTEMGYQRLDTRFTGRADASLAGSYANGRFKLRPEDTGVAAILQQFEDTGAVAKTSFGFEKKAIEAGTRRIATSWTLETQQDIMNSNGIDIEDEATQQMSFELQAEIDREMVVRIINAALSNNEWSVWDGEFADARWMGERGRAFYQNIVKRSMVMEVRNRRGPANFIIATPDVVAVLESLGEFVVMPVSNSVSTSDMQTAKAGSIGRFTVYKDTRTAVYDTTNYGYDYDQMYEEVGENQIKLPNYCMLGYKGANSWDAGIIYCPYIPIMVQKAINPVSFTPNIGLFTRYGVLDNIFGAHLYYHMIIIDSFSQPGTPDGLRGVYPPGALTPDLAGTADAAREKYRFPVESKQA